MLSSTLLVLSGYRGRPLHRIGQNAAASLTKWALFARQNGALL
jgi:hypothetical protein